MEVVTFRTHVYLQKVSAEISRSPLYACTPVLASPVSLLTDRPTTEQTRATARTASARIYHFSCDFFGFKNICQTWNKNRHLLPIFQKPRQLIQAINEEISE